MKITKKMLSAINQVSKDETRPIHNVHIKGNKSYVTDGIKATIITDGTIENNKRNCILSKESIKFIKGIKSIDSFELSDINKLQKIKAVRGNYPDILPVIPSGKPIIEISFDAKQIMQIMKSIIEFKETSSKYDNVKSFTMQIYDSKKPAKFICRNKNSNLISLLMPVKKGI